MTGVAYDRCVSGLWRDNEKMVWNTFMSDRHVLHRGDDEFTGFVVPIDFGFTNPTSILCLGQDASGKIHVLSDFAKSRMLISEIVAQVEIWRGRNPICVVDPSAATLIAELRDKGFAVESAYNSVEDGLELVRDMFAKAAITVEPGCSKLVSDIETYQRDANDRVIKVNDHRCDALRYGCCYAMGKRHGGRIFVARVGEEA
jgi:phage terminase large subunit